MTTLLTSTFSPFNLTLNDDRAHWIPADVHGEFRILRHLGAPLNSEGLGLNCVNAMYDLCLLNQNINLHERTWSEDEWDLYLKMSFSKVQHGTWGIYTVFHTMAKTNEGYLPLATKLFKGTRMVGRIVAAHSTQPFGTEDIGNESAVYNDTGPVPSIASSIPIINNSIGVSNLDFAPSVSALPWNVVTVHDFDTTASRVAARATFSYSFSYTGGSFRNKELFYDLLGSMGYLATMDRNMKIGSVGSAYGLELESKADEQGNPLLKIRYVYRIIQQLAKWMVKNHEYKDTDIIFSVDGKVVATGRYRRSALPTLSVD